MLNVGIIVLLFIVYATILMKIAKYFRLHLIKRHIYLVGNLHLIDKDNWYGLGIFYGFFHKFCMNRILLGNILTFFYEKLFFNFHKKDYGSDFDNLSFIQKMPIRMNSPVDPECFIIKYPFVLSISWFICNTWHYFLLFSAIVFDIFFNNLMISHIFAILPWIFFYEIYLRFSKFIDGLWLPHDQFLHTFLYSKHLEILDKKTLYIDHEYYDLEHFRLIYKTYILKDFIKNPEHL